ncbi:MAG: class I SAM-dependent methyltransferase [Bacteroidetes bacterium]|nr:MAG: class I SAM-dependent methyltransferase [Bacteroidota bacterium]
MKYIEKYYDDYVDRQLAVGINDRHRSIQRWLVKFGLKKGDRVLEIGCGIGTQTQLIANYLGPQGHITAVDISDKSIETARKRLGHYRQVKLVAADIVQYELEEEFDVIVMPDVIEHIPLELHHALFGKVSKLLKAGGFVMIHLPNPYFLAWCHEHRRDLLQVIDQPIYTDVLVQNVYPHNLYIHHLETYSVFLETSDYQVIVLKKKPEEIVYQVKQPDLRKRVEQFAEKVRLKIRRHLK